MASICLRRFLSHSRQIRCLKTNPFVVTKRWLACSAVSLTGFDSSTLSYASKGFASLYDYSIKNPDNFWGTLGREKLQWIEDFHTVSSSDLNVGKHSWFLGGKLNASGDYSDNIVLHHPRHSPE